MKHFFLFLALFLSFFGMAQTYPFRFDGLISNQDTGGKEAGVSIALKQGGATIMSTTSVSNGKYVLEGPVDYSKPFELVYSKSGFVSKKLYFDFSLANAEDFPPGAMRPAERLDFSLFKEREGVDFSFLENEPVGKFEWGAGGFMVDFDKKQHQKMQDKIDKLLAQAEQQDAAKDAEYNTLITQADQLFNGQKYEEALVKYEAALGLKPTEAHPSNRIIEIDAILQKKKEEELAEQQANQEYYNLIEAADNLRNQEDYENAIDKYEEALTIKDDPYPKAEIQRINQIIEDKKKEAANEAAYKELIQVADMLFKQKSYKVAAEKYREASALKPSEQHPKDRLAEIEKLQKEQDDLAALKKKYEDAVKEGDRLFGEEKYEESKAKFEEALAIESAATYPQGKIDEINGILAELNAEKEKTEKIAKLLEEGGVAFNGALYEDALAKYKEVLTLEATNKTAIDRIAEIEKIAAEAAEKEKLEAEFNQLVKEGDEAVQIEQLETAVSKYESALVIKNESAVQTKLDNVKALMAAKENEAKLKDQFDQIMQAAESLAQKDDIEAAISKFEEAKALIPSNPQPQKRIDELNDQLASILEANEKQEKFNRLMGEGEELAGKEDFLNAISKYTEAKDLFPSNQEPQKRIDALNAKLKEQEEANQKLADFNALVKAGDDFKSTEAYNDALGKYNEALKLFPNDEGVKSKINDVNALLANQAAEQEKIKQYESLLADANELINQNKLPSALSKAEEAKNLIPARSEAPAKIDEINNLIKKQEDLAAQEAKVNALLEEGKQLFNAENWEQAKLKYEEVLTIDSGNDEATSRIDLINKKLNELASAKELEEKFKKLVEDGDLAVSNSDFQSGINKFNEALNIKDDASVRTKLENAKKSLETLNAENEQAAKISQLLSEGSSLMSQTKYDEAKTKYEEVLTLDDKNNTAITKLQEIEQKERELADQAALLEKFNRLKQEGFTRADNKDYQGALVSLNDALTIKADAEIDSKIESIKAAMLAEEEATAREQRYKDLLSKGETQQTQGNYQLALDSYKEASSIKPSEQLPKDKIAELQKLIDQENASADLDRQYRNLIEDGDDLVEDKRYVEAIEKFNDALALKPNEQEPVDKARRAQQLADELSKTEEDEAYEKILTTIRTKIDEEDYSRAKELIDRAINLRNEDERPKTLLKEIQEIEKRKAEFDTLISKGDSQGAAKNYEEAINIYNQAKALIPSSPLPDQKIDALRQDMNAAADAEQKERLFKEYMDKGASNVNAKNYELALNNYQNALNLKPSDSDAKAKLAEVQSILDKIENERVASIAEQNKFDGFIKQADAYFDSQDYPDAIKFYEKALGVFPNNAYAKGRIEESERRAIALRDAEDERRYQELLSKADSYLTDANYDRATELYNRAITFRPADQYPKDKLAEIDAILNPSTAAGPTLEDLGELYDNSIMDGTTALAKAQEQRENLKTTKVKNKLNGITDAEVEMTVAKTQDHYDASNQIYDVYKQITVETIDNDEHRKAIVEALRKADNEKELLDISDNQFEQASVVNAQGTLDIVEITHEIDYHEREDVYVDNHDAVTDVQMSAEDVYKDASDDTYMTNVVTDKEFDAMEIRNAINYYESESVYAENHENVEVIHEAAENEYSSSSSDFYVKNISSDKVLDKVEVKVANNSKDNYDKRTEVANLVDDVKIAAGNAYTEGQTSDYIANVDSEQEIDNIYIDYEVASENQSKHAPTNKAELVVVEDEVIRQTDNQITTETLHAYSTDKGIKNVQIKVANDSENRDLKRVDNVEKIKSEAKSLAESADNQSIKEQGKYIDNKLTIEEETLANTEIYKNEDVLQSATIAGLEQKSKKANSTFEETLLSDESERLAAQSGVEHIKSNEEDKTKESIDKQSENVVKLNDIDKSAQDQYSGIVDSKKEKLLDATQELSKVDNAPKDKVIEANTLGEEFPEGVTQQVYQRKDKDGILEAIITRRIVVIEGRGTVYVKTQSLNAITYTKNGVPTTEYVWQKETQGPNLAKHY